MKILVTGGLGYIGSHTCIELIKKGYEVIIVDDLSNSSLESLNRINQLCDTSIPFFKLDIRNRKALTSIFENFLIDGVIHFAGSKAVGESIEKPIEYYDNNFVGALILTDVMNTFNCKTLVFSSTASVYGNPDSVPIKEDFPLEATNPYGRSKLMIEFFLKDVFVADNSWNIVLLRYFNPIGAHHSGLIGEDPKGIPNNLIPYIAQVAAGKLKKLSIYGGDYNTHDGTGVRDYIHVVDLAKGHLRAIEMKKNQTKVLTLNLGTGEGYSVLDVVKAFEKVSNKTVPFEIVGRRVGDVEISYADTSHAAEILNWKAERKLEQMCYDTWHWQLKNPNGFKNKLG